MPTPTTPLGVDPLSGFGDIAYALYDPAVEDAIVEAEQHDFDAFLKERFDIPFRPALHEGDPARIILDDADEMDIDMIVMAKRRHSAIERMLMGSVTNTVAREAKQAVVLFPIHELRRLFQISWNQSPRRNGPAPGTPSSVAGIRSSGASGLSRL